MKATQLLILGAAALLLIPWGTAEGASRIKTEHFDIRYEGIDETQAADFARQAEQAFEDVTAYLGKSYRRKIVIKIGDKYRVPRARTRDSLITIPANRIRGDAGGPKRIQGRGPAIVHEVTHLVAPGKGQRDRFLVEGLGVYMQEKFGGPDDRSYPSMGRDIHEETVRLVNAHGSVIAFSDAEKVRKAKKGGVGRSAAYLTEGSFVRYLIESYGLSSFMKVYEGKSYKSVYKKDRDQMESEWLAFMREQYGFSE